MTPGTSTPAVGSGAATAHRPFFIGVAGGTCSGKTTVSERLAELTGEEHLALIKLDSYYVALADQPFEARRAFNYDHPDAFDFQLLNDHIAALSAGASVPVPVYDFPNYTRTDQVRMVHPARIVVVEGILVLYEPTLRDLLAEALSERAQVLTASSGREALELLEHDERFDAILCDLMMPGMTGVELYEWLEARLPELAARTVFMTGAAYTARTRDFLERIENACLSKPFRVRDVEQVLDRVLGRLVTTA